MSQIHARTVRAIAVATLSAFGLSLAGCGDIPAEPEKQTTIQKVEKKVEAVAEKTAEGAKDLTNKAGKAAVDLEHKAGKAIEDAGKGLQKDAENKKSQ